MNKEDELLNKLIKNEEKIEEYKEKHNSMKNNFFDNEFFSLFLTAIIAIGLSILNGFILLHIGIPFIIGPIVVLAIGTSLILAEEDIGYGIVLSPFILFYSIFSAIVYLRHIVKIKSYERENKKIEEKINELESIEKEKEKKEEFIKSRLLEEEKVKEKEKVEKIDHPVIKEFYSLFSKTNDIKNEKYRNLYSTKTKTLLNEYVAKIKVLLYNQVVNSKKIELSNTSLLSLDSEYLKKCRKIEVEINKLIEIEKEIEDIEEEELMVTNLTHKNNQTLLLKK